MITKNIKKSLSVVNVCNRITKKHLNFTESHKLFITLEGLLILQYSTTIVSIVARILTFQSQKTTLKVPKNPSTNGVGCSLEIPKYLQNENLNLAQNKM